MFLTDSGIRIVFSISKFPVPTCESTQRFLIINLFLIRYTENSSPAPAYQHITATRAFLGFGQLPSFVIFQHSPVTLLSITSSFSITPRIESLIVEHGSPYSLVPFFSPINESLIAVLSLATPSSTAWLVALTNKIRNDKIENKTFVIFKHHPFPSLYHLKLSFAFDHIHRHHADADLIADLILGLGAGADDGVVFHVEGKFVAHHLLERYYPLHKELL